MLQGSITESGAGRVQSEVVFFFFFFAQEGHQKATGEMERSLAEGQGMLQWCAMKKMPVVGA